VGVKDALSPQPLFSDLGLKYVGPVDGHDLAAMEAALRRARDFGGTVVVHAVTRKGCGYGPAENDEIELMHVPGAFDLITGAPLGPPKGGWTTVFAEEMVRLGGERPDLVGITAAMLHPVGLAPFAAAYPDCCFDVGIAEQHALTAAAGMATAGLHPVVALYSTFLNRAFDQLLMDVALHRQPVTLVLDRSGVTGNDGPSHNGMWDLSLLGIVPGIRVAAPRDAETLREELREAVAVDDGPSVLRYPKGSVPERVPAVRRRVDGVDVLREPSPGEPSPGEPSPDEPADVLLACVGSFAELGLAAADRLADQGIRVTVVDPRWVLPVPEALIRLVESHRLVVTAEDAGGHAPASPATVRSAVRTGRSAPGPARRRCACRSRGCRRRTDGPAAISRPAARRSGRRPGCANNGYVPASTPTRSRCTQHHRPGHVHERAPRPRRDLHPRPPHPIDAAGQSQDPMPVIIDPVGPPLRATRHARDHGKCARAEFLDRRHGPTRPRLTPTATGLRALVSALVSGLSPVAL
jgi:transketolase C-terminal domain/subunit